MEAASTARVRWLDHTADVGVEIAAADVETLFAAALRALMAVMLGAPPTTPDGVREIRIDAGSLERLLVRWLEEWIFLIHSSRRVPVDIELQITERDGWLLRATVHDAALEPLHDWRGEVKGATYHGLEVRRDDGTWRASIVIDV